jgi:hypothetical protein
MSGRSGLGSSRHRLRTPASAGHPSQSSTGRDKKICLVRSIFAKSKLTLRRILRSPELVRDALRGSGDNPSTRQRRQLRIAVRLTPARPSPRVACGRTMKSYSTRHQSCPCTGRCNSPHRRTSTSTATASGCARRSGSAPRSPTSNASSNWQLPTWAVDDPPETPSV